MIQFKMPLHPNSIQMGHAARFVAKKETLQASIDFLFAYDRISDYFTRLGYQCPVPRLPFPIASLNRLEFAPADRFDDAGRGIKHMRSGNEDGNHLANIKKSKGQE